MSRLDDILDKFKTEILVADHIGLSDNYHNATNESIQELISTLLGESIRDTNNSDEAIALFRERVKEL